MSDVIDKMGEQFKSEAELRAYSNAQYQTILSLSQKIKKLEDETVELKKQLLNSTPKDPSEESLIQNDLKMGKDHEVIAKIQLNRYKDITMERELSLEETKKVEILVKVLFAGKEKKSGSNEVSEMPDKIDTKELIAMFEDLK